MRHSGIKERALTCSWKTWVQTQNPLALWLWPSEPRKFVWLLLELYYMMPSVFQLENSIPGGQDVIHGIISSHLSSHPFLYTITLLGPRNDTQQHVVGITSLLPLPFSFFSSGWWVRWSIYINEKALVLLFPEPLQPNPPLLQNFWNQSQESFLGGWMTFLILGIKWDHPMKNCPALACYDQEGGSGHTNFNEMGRNKSKGCLIHGIEFEVPC